MAITSANQLELLQTAAAVAREKMIEPELVIEAMEESLARAAKSRYGAEMDIRVSIDRKTGKATFTRVRTVSDSDEIENLQAEIPVEDAAVTVAQSRPDVVVVAATAPVLDEDGNAVDTKTFRRFLMRKPTETDKLLMEGVDQNAAPAPGDEIVDEVPPV